MACFPTWKKPGSNDLQCPYAHHHGAGIWIPTFAQVEQVTQSWCKKINPSTFLCAYGMYHVQPPWNLVASQDQNVRTTQPGQAASLSEGNRQRPTTIPRWTTWELISWLLARAGITLWWLTELWKITMSNGYINNKWPFSIAMLNLNYRRVRLIQYHFWSAVGQAERN